MIIPSSTAFLDNLSNFQHKIPLAFPASIIFTISENIGLLYGSFAERASRNILIISKLSLSAIFFNSPSCESSESICRLSSSEDLRAYKI
ncbi:MAG: hypothetical protein A2312_03460 [Candidatus Staskawiczbacteria bacterium RIFOXYB2_FULL_32_9]|nr:MAG: hypothetical protein A2312_03460 [Candidatus Staskawiczbacteria bacterium RIFOXYB2_FULL_32_9]